MTKGEATITQAPTIFTQPETAFQRYLVQTSRLKVKTREGRQEFLLQISVISRLGCFISDLEAIDEEVATFGSDTLPIRTKNIDEVTMTVIEQVVLDRLLQPPRYLVY